MKQILILILGLMLLSCVENKQQTNYKSEKKKYIPKYKAGELVCVGDYQFIIAWSATYKDDTYFLDKVDCKRDKCRFYVLEEEIKKCEP